MLLHLVPRVVAQSLLRMKFQQAIDEVLQLIAEIGVFPGPIVLRCYDDLLYSGQILEFSSGERSTIVGEFECEYAKHPQINLPSVSFVQYHFRCIVGRRACFGPALLPWDFLGQSEVRQLHVSVFKDEYVLWLQVAIHDILLVQILHTQHQTAKDKSDCGLSCLLELFSAFGLISDERVGVSALRVLHHEIEIFLIPEGVVQGGYKGAFGLEEDLAFKLHAAHQLLLVDFKLRHSLYRVFLDDPLGLVFLQLGQEHVSEGTSADAVGYIEAAPFYGLPVAVNVFEGLDDFLLVLQLLLRFLFHYERSGSAVLRRLGLIRSKLVY